MKRYWRCFGLPILVILLTNHAYGQFIELKSLALNENKLEIKFNLVDSVEERFYTIRVYSSVDGYLNPLEKIQGDYGLAVKPGPNKIVTWAFKEELAPGFNDKVSIEIRARIFIPFINTESINQYKVFKRKRKYNLTWSGGSPQNVMNFDLLAGDKKITTFPNIANVGHHSFEFPAHVKPGGGYRFRISDTKNKDEIVFTEYFKIRRKVPLIAKILPGLVMASVVYLLLPDGKKESDIPEAPVGSLPPRS